MRIILKSLELSNFKKLSGLWEFKEGKNVFFGKNGTGKTTLCDAERWLRMGKNSLGQSNFDIKTIIHGQSFSKHSVIGLYNIDGRELKLERVYKEKWAKKRGSLETEFEGHKTTYSIDGRPISKKDFDTEVYDIFGDEVFKLTSDPTYFPKLKWQDRRKILTVLAGDIDKDKIIDSIPGFREFFGGHSLSIKMDMVILDKKRINDEMKQLPARIDELQRQITEVTGDIDIHDAEVKVLELKREISFAKKDIDDFKSGSNSEIVKQLQNLNEQLRKAVSEFEVDKSKANKVYTATEQRIQTINDKVEEKRTYIKNYTDRVDKLRSEYFLQKADVFKEKGNVCNYCGENLDCHNCNEEDVEALKLFNKDKSEELQRVLEICKEIAVKKKAAELLIKDLEKESENLLPLVKPEILSWSGNIIIEDLQKKIKQLDVEELSPIPPPELFQKLEQLEAELEKALESLAIVKTQTETKKRIEELEEQKKKLSGEFDEVEKFLYLLAEYNKKLAEATEKPVNAMFKYISFRMFSTQVNGSIVPTCDMMSKDGRPYETALSGGERIKAGLDIIKTMSEHFKMWSPVFIDNAESITDMPDMDTQTIELRASEEHNELTQI